MCYSIVAQPKVHKELKSIDPPPFVYEGKNYTAYEATQQQRKMERAMRKQKDRCVCAEASGDKESFTTSSIRLHRQKYIYEDFSKKAGLYTQFERTQVNGFGRSIATKSGVAMVNKEFSLLKKTIGTDSMPDIDNFRKMLYNNSDEYKLLRKAFNDKVLKSDFSEISHLKGALSDKITRKWYINRNNEIPSLIDKTKTAEEQALQAFNLRNTHRTQARDLMLNQDEREFLDRKHPNHSFEEALKDKMCRKGLSKDEAIEDILKTATKTNKKVDSKFVGEE